MKLKAPCRELGLRVFLLLALGLAPPIVSAADPGGAAAAVRQVERQTGGRVLKVTPSGAGYEVKVLLPDGVIRTIHVASGR